MLKGFLIRLFSNSLGLWLAASLIPGISYQGKIWVILVAALLFTMVNATIRPIVMILSLPAILVTLGLFTLVVNTLMLYIVTVLFSPFQIGSTTAAVLAVIIIWLVNYGLSALED